MDLESPPEGGPDSKYQPQRNKDETHCSPLQQCPVEGAMTSQCQRHSSEEEIHPVRSQQSPGKAAEVLKSQQDELKTHHLVLQILKQPYRGTGAALAKIFRLRKDEKKHYEYPYVCSQCGQGFKWRYYLTQHKIRAHSKYKTVRERQSEADDVGPSAPKFVTHWAEDTLATSPVAFQQKPLLKTSQTKNLSISHHCGKDFRWPSALAQHQQSAYVQEEAVIQADRRGLDEMELPGSLEAMDVNGAAEGATASECQCHSAGGRELEETIQLANVEEPDFGNPTKESTVSEYQPHRHGLESCSSAVLQSEVEDARTSGCRAPSSEVAIQPVKTLQGPEKGASVLEIQHHFRDSKTAQLTFQLLRTLSKNSWTTFEKYSKLLNDEKSHTGGRNWLGVERLGSNEMTLGSPAEGATTSVCQPPSYEAGIEASLEMTSKLRNDTKDQNRHPLTCNQQGSRQSFYLTQHCTDPAAPRSVTHWADNSSATSPVAFQQKPSLKRKRTRQIGSTSICDHCGKDFKWPSALARHHQSAYVQEEVVRQDDQRRKETDQLGNVEEMTLGSPVEGDAALECRPHKKSAPANFNAVFRPKSTLNSKKSICDHCGKDFRWPSELARHRQRTYVREEIARQQLKSTREGRLNPFVVLTRQEVSTEHPFTSVPLKTDDALTNLVAGQSNGNVQAHVCELCGKDFAWLSDLVQHRSIHFGNETDRSNATQSVLASAPLHVDNSLEPFSSKASQKAEERHSAEYWCTGDFDKESGIVSKAIDTDQSKYLDEPYICGLCGKGFQSISDLGSHKRNNYRKRLVAPQNYYFRKAYRCYQCGKSFPRPFNLWWHECHNCSGRVTADLDNDFKKPYMCGWCGKSFQWFCKLARHEGTSCRGRLTAGKRVQLKKPYVCSLCGKSFRWPCILGRHVHTNCRGTLTNHQSNHLKKPYLCGQCGEGFQWLSNLGQHKLTNCRRTLMIDQSKYLKKLYMCGQCGKSFQGLSDLGLHKHTNCRQQLMTHQINHVKKPYTCGFCGKSFQWLSNLGRHKYTSSRGKLTTSQNCYFWKPYNCYRRGIGFRWPSNLGQHQHATRRRHLLADHRIDLKKPYSCGLCGKSFQWLSNLGRHKHSYCRGIPVTDQENHLEKLYTCGLCWKSFQWLCKLVRHTCISCTGRKMNQKPYICGLCGKSFQWSCYLVKHQRTNCKRKLITDQNNQLKKPYICGRCGKSFQWLSNLDRHKLTNCKRMLITGQSNHFKRDYINNQGSHSLEQDEAVHFTDKPLIKSTLRTSSTERRSSHTKKSYLCDQCGQSFQWLSGLNHHMYVHLGDHPYACATCGCRFRRRVQLVKHQQLHEEYQISRCLCSMDFEKQCKSSSSLKACECGVCPAIGDTRELLSANTF